MASQLYVNRSTVGVANLGDGIINIGRDLVLGTTSEESFEELDPPRESKVFEGREEDMLKLEALFFGEDVKRKVVIHGLPGFGKTELAVRFAKHCKDSANIDKAFWVNAETSENLKSLHKILKKVYKLFENKRCLFVFDNGVSRSSIRQYEPPNIEHFYLLITSHIADWDDDIYQMPLKPLNIEASINVFREILGGRYQIDEENTYKKMIKFVSNAPLGLIVIAGHLRFKMDACKQGKFNTNHFLGEITKMLYTKIHHCQRSYENSIYAAMCITLDKIFKHDFVESEQIRELSSTLLGICAYLDSDYIHIKHIKEIMECSEENIVEECVYISENFSFVEYYNGFIKIHRLCQRILKLYFDEINKDYYSGCVRWLLRTKYFFPHGETVFKEADGKKEIILKIYEENVFDNRSLYIGKLLRCLVKYGCYESCELIFRKINFGEKKQFVENMKLLHDAVYYNQADVLKLLLEYGDINVRDSGCSTPLHWASGNGAIDIVRMLLEKGGDVLARDNEGNTPLHRASWQRNLDLVRILVEKGGDVHARNSAGQTPLHWVFMDRRIYVEPQNLDFEGSTPLHFATCKKKLDGWLILPARDRKSKTPLHYVSRKRNVDIVRTLVEKGGDVHAQDSEGKTPLHWASWQGDVDTVQMLLDKGADMLAQDNNGKTPLHWASEEGKVDIVQMLLAGGGDVHAQDIEGKTPLHWASRQRIVDIVRMLLDKGGDVHARESEGRTPLHEASWQGFVDIVRMLLDKGDVHAQDNEGKTPLHYAVLMAQNVDVVRMLLDKGGDVHVHDNEGKTPLHYASRHRIVDIVQMLLDKGGDVHARDSEGSTPLHEASWLGGVDIVRMLLDIGDVHAQDNEGKTPLHYASMQPYVDVVRVLLDKGGVVNARDSEGRTPLHEASWRGFVDVMRMLLDKGDVHAQDNEGKTPLHYASRRRCVHIVRMLLDKGGDVHARDSEGKIPLHWASWRDVNIKPMLMENEENVDSQDIEGKNPLHLASQEGIVNIVRMLLEKGSDVRARDIGGKTPLDLANFCGNTAVINILQPLMH